MNTTKQTPIERLRHHVTGAIERREKAAITEVTGEGNAPRGYAPGMSRPTLIARLENMESEYKLAAQTSETNWEAYQEALRLLGKAEAQRDELLAALKQTLDALYNETCGRRQGDTQWIIGVKSAAKAAISKAEGN